MKTKSLNTLIWGLITALSLSACTVERTKLVTSDPSAPGNPSGTQLSGTSSGGGSFGDESSMVILDKAKTDLANWIKNASPEIFVHFPKNWSQQKMSEVLKSVRSFKNDSRSRYERELMFDYGKDEKTGEPYIAALSLFYRSHASVPVNSLNPNELETYVKEIRLKLLHELAHLLGIGLSENEDKKARSFAEDLIIALDQDVFLCMSKDAGSDPCETNSHFYSAWNNYSSRMDERVLTLHRPSGTTVTDTGVSNDAAIDFPYMEWFEVNQLRFNRFQEVVDRGIALGFYSDGFDQIVINENMNYSVSFPGDEYYLTIVDCSEREEQIKDYDAYAKLFEVLDTREEITIPRGDSTKSLLTHYQKVKVLNTDTVIERQVDRKMSCEAQKVAALDLANYK